MRRLFRLRLALLNGVAALGGFLLFPTKPDVVRGMAVFSGVALLAAGGSALNQVREADLDSIMKRTMLRPIPSGRLTPRKAAAIGGGMLAAGIMTLLASGGFLPALLGAAAVVWYLCLYTPLKRRTTFALAAGAACGAVPPVVGWCSAGGSLFDSRVFLLAGLLYLWQVPHFWLLQCRHAADYRRADMPRLDLADSRRYLAGLCLLWIVAMVTGSMLLPAFGLISGGVLLCYAPFPALLIISAVSTRW